MENKQKAIEKAYGEHWETVKDYVDENGWIDAKKLDWYFMPPRSCVRGENNTWASAEIQLIETNNGWIKIESEEDLPNQSCSCWIQVKYQYTNTPFWYDFTKKCFSFKGIILFPNEVTHYKVNEQPNPPIY